MPDFMGGGVSPKQPLLRMGLHVSIDLIGKLAPNSTHSTRGLVKSVLERGFFRAFPPELGGQFCDPRPLPPHTPFDTINTTLQDMPCCRGVGRILAVLVVVVGPDEDFCLDCG